ncbi:HTH_XRE domain containing protein [uncultured Caudovirales phage]|uniref:HTH_XRE domain containing protein n=1 Tax=uncultured Caudovirales phage TaxID=2100421 RepID=A0A6J5LVA7_9CAUD|nr:HTH_XRE domain containing protein [uncultured Caudovirales phage]
MPTWHAVDMNKQQLCDAMHGLKLTVRSLAKLVEVSPSTVARWRTGRRRVPGAVARYLELKLRLVELIR